MAEKVKLSKDGNSIDFVQSESIPASVKKFRQSPEIEGFYRFIFENDLQKETFDILERLVNERKAKRKAEKLEAAPPKKVAEPKVKAEPVKIEAAKKVTAKKPEPPKKVMAPVVLKKSTPVAAKKAIPAKKIAAPAKKAAPAPKKTTKKK